MKYKEENMYTHASTVTTGVCVYAIFTRVGLVTKKDTDKDIYIEKGTNKQANEERSCAN